MATTAASLWLNTAFSGYDEFILFVFHSIANDILTFLFKLITLIGEKGIVFFLLALIFMCFSRTRKLGVCLFGAVACGALITNMILKDLIQRPRPFDASDTFKAWWQAVGSPFEDGFSFPSGHVTAAAAGMTAIRLIKGKKWTFPAIGWILIMMMARNYLMAHYPSDVLAAAIIGIASAFIAYAITKLIFKILEEHEDTGFCSFCLNFNLPDLAGIPSKLGLIEKESKKEKGYVGKFKDDVDEYERGNLKMYAIRGSESADSDPERVTGFAGRSIPRKTEQEESRKTERKPAIKDVARSRRDETEKSEPIRNSRPKAPAAKTSSGVGYVGKHVKK